MFGHWLIRLALIARNPPSPKKAMVVGAVVLIVLAAAGLEALGLWPDWAQAEKMPTRIMRP
ncbi:hypothetical protein [Pseudoponticoccus marisrubri]|uniref:Uncharacterized protein n=1 Tax=Pseudoponticoccus marisrubri TaxID=1685382 RepID=A0A0W7WM94_9RHOB|nr:hypothetical protein [Pseudoponticoccus marisrubri]KUF11715.1 hypothetical protein AVJ23_03780 [Pseudoponticoccus marisrubri]